MFKMKIKSDYLHSRFAGAMSSVLLKKRDVLRDIWAGQKCVCISFDCDFPEDMKACGPIVDFLTSATVPASFAIPGHLASRFPKVVANLIEYDQEILNHTLSHFSNFRNTNASIAKKEVEGFQELMAKSYNYTPKGFRCPHGLRKISSILFDVLKLNGLYDTSLLGHSPTRINGLYEIPLTPCPEHPFMAFDSYHNFRFPFFCASEKKVLSLWIALLQKNTFINIFFDPIDFAANTRFSLLKQIVENAKAYGFTFTQMGTLFENQTNNQ
jgi:peptidoglycan/xylan/chitin deacetylase (PgdA/CDA1 family)